MIVLIKSNIYYNKPLKEATKIYIDKIYKRAVSIDKIYQICKAGPLLIFLKNRYFRKSFILFL